MRFVVEPPQQETLALEIGELDYMYLSDKGWSLLIRFQSRPTKFLVQFIMTTETILSFRTSSHEGSQSMS